MSNCSWYGLSGWVVGSWAKSKGQHEPEHQSARHHVKHRTLESSILITIPIRTSSSMFIISVRRWEIQPAMQSLLTLDMLTCHHHIARVRHEGMVRHTQHLDTHATFFLKFAGAVCLMSAMSFVLAFLKRKS